MNSRLDRLCINRIMWCKTSKDNIYFHFYQTKVRSLSCIVAHSLQVCFATPIAFDLYGVHISFMCSRQFTTGFKSNLFKNIVKIVWWWHRSLNKGCWLSLCWSKCDLNESMIPRYMMIQRKFHLPWLTNIMSVNSQRLAHRYAVFLCSWDVEI